MVRGVDVIAAKRSKNAAAWVGCRSKKRWEILTPEDKMAIRLQQAA
jgi:hypothetical protein